jgi:hypothetical protein
MNAFVNRVIVVLASVLFVGCTPMSTFVEGQTSYADAVKENGATESTELLSDGSKVCTWVVGVSPNWVDKQILVFDSRGVLVSKKQKRF